MSYVYDIVLNFNNDFYDFYEWKKDDIIYHIKRINLILVDSKIYNEIYDHMVKFSDDFLLSIFNKCEYYDNRKISSIPYAFLLTDSYRVMGIMLDNGGKIIKYSSLLLDEEEEVLDLCYKLGKITLDYEIIDEREKKEFTTRQEKYLIKYLKRELTNDYNEKNINKLKYLYYEYFNKENNDIEIIYHELLNELNKTIEKKHYDLYDLIKLSYSSKSV